MDRFFSHLKQPFTSIWLCSGFVIGCFITLYTFGTAAFYIMSFAILLAGAYFKPFLILLSGFICAIFLVIFHYLIFYSVSDCKINYQLTRVVKFEVIESVSAKSPFYIKARLINIESCERIIRPAPLAMLSITSDKPLLSGDLIEGKVKLKRYRSVKNFDSFDSERNALKERIFYKGRSVGEVSSYGHQQGNNIRERYRQYISSITENTRLQWLYYALLTGDRSKISYEDNTQLRELGLTHLLAISGLHIGLIYAIGFYTSKWLVKVSKLQINQAYQLNNGFVLFGFSCALIYVYLSDFIVSATRALVMLGCYLVIYQLGKNPLRWRSILYALTLVLLIDPFSLLNPGLYFSFTAVTIIFLLTKHTLDIKLGLIKRISQLMYVQLALFFGLLPLSLFYFDGTSVIGLIVNLIAVPLVGLVLLPLLIFYSLISSFLDVVSLLSLVDSVLSFGYQLLLSIPKHWRWFSFSEFNFTLLTISYLSLLILLFSPKKYLSVLPLFIYIIDCKLQPKVQFQVDVFDVGHGLMVMISAHEHALIYDLGPRHFSRYDYINRVLVRNINKHALTVSATLISHLDNDHAGGLSSWYQAGYRDTFSTFHPEGLRKPCENKQLRFEGLIINSFHADVNGDNRNDQSCLLKISSLNYSVLLTGDISALAEATLIEKGVDLQATVLLSPHHGSNTSSSVRFIDAVNPKMVIHSSAYQGQWHFPHPEVVKRYQQRNIPQFSTAEQGHIRIVFYRDSYRLEFAREQESYWFEQD